MKMSLAQLLNFICMQYLLVLNTFTPYLPGRLGNLKQTLVCRSTDLFSVAAYLIVVIAPHLETLFVCSEADTIIVFERQILLLISSSLSRSKVVSLVYTNEDCNSNTLYNHFACLPTSKSLKYIYLIHI